MKPTMNYTIYKDVDGKLHRWNHAKRGRKPQSPELVRVKMEFRTLPATKTRVIAEAKKHGVTPSRYIDLAVSLFDVSEFSSYENR